MVTAELDLERNADSPGEDLFLDGEELKLFRVYARGADGKVAQLKVNNPLVVLFHGRMHESVGVLTNWQQPNLRFWIPGMDPVRPRQPRTKRKGPRRTKLERSN